MRYAKIQLHLLVLTASFATAAMAQDRSATAAPAAVPNRQVTFRDPLTGQVREPTEAELAELSRAIEHENSVQSRAMAGAPQTDTRVHWRSVRLSNGREGKLAKVPEALQSRLVIEREPDGQYRVHHAGSPAETKP